MKQSELENLRAQAAKVKLPQSVCEAVIAEATTLDRTEQQSATRRLTRRNFLRVGVAAAAVGVGAFLGLSIFGNEDTLPVFGSGNETSGNGTTKQRGFVLTAFAEELVSEDGTTFPVKNMISNRGQGSSDADGMYDAEYIFVVYGEVQGDGDGTITYELEGPHAQDVLDDDLNQATEPLIFFGNNNGEVTVPGHDYYSKRFSSVFGSYGGNQAVHVLEIKAHFPMSDALKAAVENGDRRTQLLEARHCFNEMLAETTLRIIVSYGNELPVTDFTGYETYVENYAIEPTDGFDATCGEYIDKLVSLEEQGYIITPYGVVDLDNITADETELRQELDRIEQQYWFYTVREITG